MNDSIAVSLLDLASIFEGRTERETLERSVRIAQFAESLGYKRFWMGEHHNLPSIASTAPDLMAMRVADSTETIHVGSGGVMLPNHASLLVAERFLTLEAFHPGRIDLGLGRANGTDPLTARAIRRDEAADFDSQLVELAGFMDGNLPAQHPFSQITAHPQLDRRPPFYILGSSLSSAHLAASRGEPYVFASHFSPGALVPAIRAYRDNFRPGAIHEPYTIVAATVFIAQTESAAHEMASSSTLAYVNGASGQPSVIPSLETVRQHAWTQQESALAESLNQTRLVGDQGQVAEQLRGLVAATGADEIMVTASIDDEDAYRSSLALVAESAARGFASTTLGTS